MTNIASNPRLPDGGCFGRSLAGMVNGILSSA
jgi:hypothetical protein